MSARNRTEEAADLLEAALALLAPVTGGEESKSPSEVLRRLAPAGTSLYVSRASNGLWWWYLVMPQGWAPPEGPRRWLYNDVQGHYWDTGVARHEGGALRPDAPENTKSKALVAGLFRLLGVLA